MTRLYDLVQLHMQNQIWAHKYAKGSLPYSSSKDHGVYIVQSCTSVEFMAVSM